MRLHFLPFLYVWIDFRSRFLGSVVFEAKLAISLSSSQAEALNIRYPPKNTYLLSCWLKRLSDGNTIVIRKLTIGDFFTHSSQISSLPCRSSRTPFSRWSYGSLCVRRRCTPSPRRDASSAGIRSFELGMHCKPLFTHRNTRLSVQRLGDGIHYHYQAGVW